jgi:hypothetical protein
MDEPKPLYDLSDNELAKLMRDYPRGVLPTYGHDLGAENERREGIRNRRLTLCHCRRGLGVFLGRSSDRELYRDLFETQSLIRLPAGCAKERSVASI